jgi:hypothetical protein
VTPTPTRYFVVRRTSPSSQRFSTYTEPGAPGTPHPFTLAELSPTPPGHLVIETPEQFHRFLDATRTDPDATARVTVVLNTRVAQEVLGW